MINFKYQDREWMLGVFIDENQNYEVQLIADNTDDVSLHPDGSVLPLEILDPGQGISLEQDIYPAIDRYLLELAKEYR